MQIKDLEKLNIPDSPGVYFFRKSLPAGGSASSEILYIGRATALRDRVKSYFKNDLIEARGPLLVDMVTKADTLEWQESDSVLEAIILESNLIKKFQPYYNTKEKDDKSYNYVIITKEEFPRVILIRGRNLEKGLEGAPGENLPFKIKKTFGPYPQGGLIKEALKIIRKIFPFRDEKSGKDKKGRHDLFYETLGLSPNTATAEAKKEYAKTIKYITLLFEGKKMGILKALHREMMDHAKKNEFELAGIAKRQIQALTHIQDIALIKKERPGSLENGGGSDGLSAVAKPFRIEAYDISHFGGSETVGVMVVVEDGMAKKSDYRMFKIKSGKGNDDINNTKEVLERRLKHTEWPMPDLIVMDGGDPMRNMAINAFSLCPQTKIVNVIKDEKHKPREIRGEEATLQMIKEQKRESEVLLANAEAHRFSLSYQKKLRRIRLK
ncbi:MAG: hypothetical protein WCP15_02595 [bacterium]